MTVQSREAFSIRERES